MMILRPILSRLLLVLLGMPAFLATAQEFADPESAARNPDFAVQGEYAGGERAMQAIATGDGGFTVVIYEGGLPGAGWSKEPPRRIDVDAETVKELVESMGMRRVDRASPTLGATPPPGANVLFDGSQASLDRNWQEGARLDDDGLLMPGATTKADFTDYTLHLEFRTPFHPTAAGQARGNSGVYHQGRYETQILDSFGLQGLNNEAGGIYTIRDPDLNMAFPPLTWQTYDVDFIAARYDEDGNRIAAPRMTVRLNGVTVHNDVSVPHATRAAPSPEGPSAGPIHLQDHGSQVRFRNIWILPRDIDGEARRPLVPGFERFYASPSAPNPGDGGRLLISNLGCGNCHSGEPRFWQFATGPVLTDVGSRIRPDHLVRWIANPHEVKPGTTMPDTMGGMDATTRRETAEAIASYLLIQGGTDGWTDRAGDARGAQRGESLFHTIGCVACHAPQNGMTAPSATSVPLGPIHEKYSLDSLTRFLADPHAVRPDGRMPRLVSDATEARDIATYLLREVVLVPGAGQFERTVYRGWWDRLPDFASLDPAGPPGIVNGLSLEGITPLDGFGAVYEAFLPIGAAGSYTFILGSDDGSRVLIDGQEIVRVGGTHPYQTHQQQVELTEGVHRLRVEYFEGGGEERLTLEIEAEQTGRAEAATLVTQDPTGAINLDLVPSTFQPDASLVERGRQAFGTLGCANCHRLAGEPQSLASTISAPPMDRLTSDQGCLADEVPNGLPRFDLTRRQKRAIGLALRMRMDSAETGALDQQVHLTMAAANCYACHSRGTVGGPEPARDELFQTTTPEMGNEGRVPPPLDGVGDKLTDSYLSTLLEQGANDRPYMQTRMPAYGHQPLKGFHQAVVQLDRRKTTQDAPPRVAEHRLEADGRTLVGNDGLACIKCHTFRGEGTAGIQAIDMLKMTTRLRADWFDRYLRDPQRYRPGTRMPASFPDGVSVLTNIADGDPAYQIHAMWTYLAAGDAAKIPTGLRPGAIELIPESRPILYRAFLAGISPRGVAVGYPQRVHLAWDADIMALARIWQNQFLDASMHWRGRGAGNLAPLGDAVVDWESAAPLAVLDQMNADWPAKTGNEAGYVFRGYRLDAAGQPTFLYDVGHATIEDFPQPIASESGAPGSFVRRLTIRTGTESLVFRGGSGQIEPSVDGSYLINGAVRIHIEGPETKIVQIGDHQELRSTVPAQSTTVIIQEIEW